MFVRALLHFLFGIGYFGPFLMGVMDSSFLFLPFGNDLLVVALVVRNHAGFLWYVLAAVCGSTCGVFILDLVARRAGEAGIKKIVGERRYGYLVQKIGKRGAWALIVGCLAPPPFPFTIAVAVLSALGYPRLRMLAVVAVGRAARFLILAGLAIHFGKSILRIAQSKPFVWCMGVLIGICVLGSAWSIANWIRKSRRPKQTTPAAATA